MIIGVLSDTHIPGRAKSLPRIIKESFYGVCHIIHAGDIMTMDVLTELQQSAPVTAVAGNIDPPELKSMLGESRLAVLGGFRIGVFHGHGEKGSTLERAIERFRNDDVDCIIFGHSHMPYCGYHGGVLLFNPGSPTDKRRNKYYSFGLLDTEDGIAPRIVYFDGGGNIMSR